MLQLIHTDICGPFAKETICGNLYCITFIDDYSRYCHVYLIADKSQSLEKFKIYKAEVEKELNTEIKVVSSYRGESFMGSTLSLVNTRGLLPCFWKRMESRPNIPLLEHQNIMVLQREETEPY